MSDSMTLIARVRSILQEILEDHQEELKTIGPDDDLSVLGINSMTFIRIVLALEMEFGVTWDDEELNFQNFLTINNIVNYVESSVTQNT